MFYVHICVCKKKKRRKGLATGKEEMKSNKVGRRRGGETARRKEQGRKRNKNLPVCLWSFQRGKVSPNLITFLNSFWAKPAVAFGRWNNCVLYRNVQSTASEYYSWVCLQQMKHNPFHFWSVHVWKSYGEGGSSSGPSQTINNVLLYCSAVIEIPIHRL